MIQDDISGVEERSGSRLPGVECGASFSDMSAGILTFSFLQIYISFLCCLFLNIFISHPKLLLCVSFSGHFFVTQVWRGLRTS